MPTDHSLPALPRSASQAGRRRFDPGRPLFFPSVLGTLPRAERRDLPRLIAGAGSLLRKSLNRVELVGRRDGDDNRELQHVLQRAVILSHGGTAFVTGYNLVVDGGYASR